MADIVQLSHESTLDDLIAAFRPMPGPLHAIFKMENEWAANQDEGWRRIENRPMVIYTDCVGTEHKCVMMFKGAPEPGVKLPASVPEFLVDWTIPQPEDTEPAPAAEPVKAKAK